METYQNYKGYGIEYSTLWGTTRVIFNGFTMKTFVGLGEQKGLGAAKEYIDSNS